MMTSAIVNGKLDGILILIGPLEKNKKCVGFRVAQPNLHPSKVHCSGIQEVQGSGFSVRRFPLKAELDVRCSTFIS